MNHEYGRQSERKVAEEEKVKNHVLLNITSGLCKAGSMQHE